MARDLLALFEHQQHAVVGFGRAEAVDAADAGDDHAVAALEQRPRGGEAQLVQLVVDGGFFFDVDVARRDVGFRLIVIVIADEILDGVAGEKGFELVIELRGERLVVRQDQRRAAGLLDQLGHGEGLAGAGDAQQDLMLFAVQQPAEELIDGGGLIAARAIIDAQMKGHDSRILGASSAGCGGGRRMKKAAMKIILELPPETEANLLVQAQARGLSLDAFLRTIIATQAAATESVKMIQSMPNEGEALDRAIDDLFDTVPVPPGVGEGVMRRENWYR